MENEKIKLLVVNDHLIFRKALIRLLTERGPDFIVLGAASSGEDALEMMRSTQFDVVILDLSLPKMNGLEVARIAKEERIETKILMVSGHSSPHYIAMAAEIGVEGYVDSSNPAGILDAIGKVARGIKVFPDD